MTPTPRAALGTAIAAVTAIPLGPTAGLFVVAAVILAAIIDAWTVREAPGVSKSIAPILPRGQPVALQVRLDRPRATTVIRQPRPADIHIEPARGSGALAATVVAHRRGLHTFGPVAIRTVGPLGLGAWHHSVGEGREVRVYPDVLTARRIAFAVSRGRFEDQGKRRTLRFGLGTEFESVRDYVPDDDIRRVNWRATMRMGRPMSNEYRIDQDRDVICVVDTGRLMAAPLGRFTRLDAAVDAVAAVAYAADVLGDRVGVVAFDSAVYRQLQPRRRGGEGVVGAVYDLEPAERESNYEGAFKVVSRAKRAFVLVFTDLFEPTAAEPLEAAIPYVARRHAFAIASVSDEALTTRISAPEPTIEDAYRMSAALSALRGHRDSDRENAPRGRDSGRGTARTARRSVRGRLPRRQGIGPGLKRPGRLGIRGAAQPHETPIRRPNKHAYHHHQRCLEPVTAHKRLDNACDHDPGHRANQDQHGTLCLSREGVPPGFQNRIDQCPPHADSCRCRDDGYRKLEHAVGGDQLQEERPISGADQQTTHSAEHYAVEHEHQAGTDGPEDPRRKGDYGDPNVVGDQECRERRLVARR